MYQYGSRNKGFVVPLLAAALLFCAFATRGVSAQVCNDVSRKCNAVCSGQGSTVSGFQCSQTNAATDYRCTCANGNVALASPTPPGPVAAPAPVEGPLGTPLGSGATGRMAFGVASWMVLLLCAAAGAWLA